MPNRWVLIPNIALWGCSLNLFVFLLVRSCLLLITLITFFKGRTHLRVLNCVFDCDTVSLKCSPNIFHHIMCNIADWVSRVIPHPDQTSIRGPCTKLYDCAKFCICTKFSICTKLLYCRMQFWTKRWNSSSSLGSNEGQFHCSFHRRSLCLIVWFSQWPKSMYEHTYLCNKTFNVTFVSFYLTGA